MITHDNIMWTLRQATPVYGIGPGDRLLSFLPLSHIAERMMSEFMPIALAAETWFARSMATIGSDLPPAGRPCSWRYHESGRKLREAAESHVRGQPAPLRLAVGQYLRLGLDKVAHEQDSRPMPRSALQLLRAMDTTVGGRSASG